MGLLLKKFFKIRNRDKLFNDGIFLSNSNGTYEVLYSKYSFFKKGDIISYEVFIRAISLYKCVMVTPERICV